MPKVRYKYSLEILVANEWKQEIRLYHKFIDPLPDNRYMKNMKFIENVEDK